MIIANLECYYRSRGKVYGPEIFVQEHSEDLDPHEYYTAMLAEFNDTLRPGEHPREFVSAKIVDYTTREECVKCGGKRHLECPYCIDGTEYLEDDGYGDDCDKCYGNGEIACRVCQGRGYTYSDPRDTP